MQNMDSLPDFVGEWKNGMREGVGKQATSKGEIYEGQWV
jgi:hypothetical protein